MDTWLPVDVKEPDIQIPLSSSRRIWNISLTPKVPINRINIHVFIVDYYHISSQTCLKCNNKLNFKRFTQ